MFFTLGVGASVHSRSLRAINLRHVRCIEYLKSVHGPGSLLFHLTDEGRTWVVDFDDIHALHAHIGQLRSKHGIDIVL